MAHDPVERAVWPSPERLIAPYQRPVWTKVHATRVKGPKRREALAAPPSLSRGALRPYTGCTSRAYPALAMEAANQTSENEVGLFVHDFVDVACPIEVAQEWCHGDGRRLEPLAASAGRDADELLVRMGPSWVWGALSKEVRVSLGGCRERGAGIAVSIRWMAAQLPALFPVLDGDLEFAPIGPSQIRVILSASYVAPLGELGRRLDRALLHRIAESTVRSFLVRLAESLAPQPAESA